MVLLCVVREGYEWGCWSPCSRICGGGGRVRYAICNARDQDQYEELCNEEPYEDEECNSHSCPGKRALPLWRSEVVQIELTFNHFFTKITIRKWRFGSQPGRHGVVVLTHVVSALAFATNILIAVLPITHWTCRIYAKATILKWKSASLDLVQVRTAMIR